MIGRSWKKRENASEELYFNKIEGEKRTEIANKLLTTELRSLLAILGEKHALTSEQLHKLLEWKHNKNGT